MLPRISVVLPHHAAAVRVLPAQDLAVINTATYESCECLSHPAHSNSHPLLMSLERVNAQRLSHSVSSVVTGLDSNQGQVSVIVTLQHEVETSGNVFCHAPCYRILGKLEGCLIVLVQGGSLLLLVASK